MLGRRMKLKIRSAIILFTICVFLVSYLLFADWDISHSCAKDEFFVPSDKKCHPLLTCSDLNDINVRNMIGYGAVKVVYKAFWHKVEIALAQLNNPQYIVDFRHGLDMLQKYQNPHVVKLLGFCDEKRIILTEYHQLGNAVNVINKIRNFTDINVLHRLNLCLSYAKILQLLHNKRLGVSVNCDTNTLEKLLSQLLVTNNFTIILSDVDSLAELNNGTVKCGSKEITSNFVAPEQLWPYPELPFSDELMPGYDEKTDIWKAASVCDHFLGDDIDLLPLRYRMFEIHRKCKHIDPKERPTADDLITFYNNIIDEYSSYDEFK